MQREGQSQSMADHERLVFRIDQESETLLNTPTEVVILEGNKFHTPEIKQILPKDGVVVNLEPLQKKDCPNIVIGIPHSGTMVPKELYDRMTEFGQDQMNYTDFATERIGDIDDIPSIKSMWSRFVVDPNRPLADDPNSEAERELSIGSSTIVWDKALFSFKSEAGTQPAFQPGKEPNPDEVRRLAKMVYAPYYYKAMSLVGALHDRMKPGERTLFVDLHCFPVGQPFDAVAPYVIGKEQFEDMPLFSVGWKNDFGQIACDTDIADAFKKNIIEEFRKLDPSIQERLIGKSAANITDDDIALTEHPMQGLQNVEFWGDLGQQKRPKAETPQAQRDAMNQAFQERRSATKINAIQIEMKQTYLDFPVNAAGQKEYDKATPNETLEQAMKEVFRKAMLKVNSGVLKK